MDHKEAAATAGFTGPAVDLVISAGAQARHNSRVEDTAQAALAAADGCPLTAAFLLALDLGGIGGPLGIAGTATDRMPAFSALGKGRWNATDGPAYRAAAEAALRRISAPNLLTARCSAAGVYASWYGQSGHAFFEWSWFSARGLCPWIKAEIGRAVLAAYVTTDPAPVVAIPGIFPGPAMRPAVFRPETGGHVRWEATPGELSAAMAAANNEKIVLGGLELDPESGEVRVEYGDAYHDYGVLLTGEDYPDESPEISALEAAQDAGDLWAMGLMLVDGDTPGTSRLEFAQ
jgi:hypothetical protein